MDGGGKGDEFKFGAEKGNEDFFLNRRNFDKYTVVKLVCIVICDALFFERIVILI